MKHINHGINVLITASILIAAQIQAANTAQTHTTGKGIKPLISRAIVDLATAAEAHLKISWGVFNDAQEWYETEVSKDTTWVWDNDKARESLNLYYADGKRPAPKTGRFAVVIVEFFTIKETPISSGTNLAIGAHIEPTAKGFNGKIPVVVDEFPIGRNHNDPAMDGRFLSSELDGGRSFFLFYKDGTLLRTLWFIPLSELPNNKLTLLLHGYKPIRFTVPDWK